MSSTPYLPQTECERDEISVYQGQIVGREELKVELIKLSIAFPDVGNDAGYMALLTDRLIKNGFTRERVRDAIESIIDNFSYKRPNISDIVSFDRKVKSYSYNEIAAKCTWEYKAFEHFNRIQINGKWRYVEK